LTLVLYRRLSLTDSEVDVEGTNELVDFWIENSALE